MNTTESTGPQEQPIACNPDAFTAEERAKWEELGKRFVLAAAARRDLPNGFAFEVDRSPYTLRDLAQYFELVCRCCPFV